MGQAVSISDFATCTVSVQQLSSAAVASKHPTARCTRPWLCPKNSPSYTKQAAGQAWAVGRRSPVLLEELGQFHVSELQGCYTLSGVSGKSLDVATVKFCFKPSKKKKNGNNNRALFIYYLYLVDSILPLSWAATTGASGTFHEDLPEMAQVRGQ